MPENWKSPTLPLAKKCDLRLKCRSESARIKMLAIADIYIDTIIYIDEVFLYLDTTRRTTSQREIAVVTCEQFDTETLLIVQPNRSANWQFNKLIIAAFACWWMLIASFFVFKGLWPIIPFAGIEVAGLALA